MGVIWFVVAIAACAALAWAGLRIEPHWVSKDGRRFICQSQTLTPHGDPLTRWQETRVTLTIDDTLLVEQKRWFKRNRSYWTAAAESPDPPRGRAIFLLQGRDDRSSIVTLKLPAKSKALPALREAVRR